MHEMSIVESLLDAVREEQRAYPDSLVKTVRVRVGSLRQVVPEIMEFCYTAATRDTALADSRLEIEGIAARAQCGDCGAEFAVDEQWFECPQCRQVGARLVSGQELDLVGIELERSQVAVPAG
jgi:hydrogenase nickel incorporation protein HypA/HybF